MQGVDDPPADSFTKLYINGKCSGDMVVKTHPWVISRFEKSFFTDYTE